MLAACSLGALQDVGFTTVSLAPLSEDCFKKSLPKGHCHALAALWLALPGRIGYWAARAGPPDTVCQLQLMASVTDNAIGPSQMKDRLSRKAELRRLQGARGFGPNDL